jgi:hypothetical protein
MGDVVSRVLITPCNLDAAALKNLATASNIRDAAIEGSKRPTDMHCELAQAALDTGAYGR